MWDTITIPTWRIFLAGRDEKQSPSQGQVRILLPSPASPGSLSALCLPIKATLKENMAGGAQWEQPVSIHKPVLSPA